MAENGCQIYLIIESDDSARERLLAALQAGPIACVRISPPGSGRHDATITKSLVEWLQSRGIAALIENDAALARTLRADGVHLSAGDQLPARYEEARSILGTGAIVGVDVGTSRHDAMETGEAGADYVGFSRFVPADARPDEEGDDISTELDLPADQAAMVRWWSEIFEVPCVAFDVHSAADAREYARSGADFVALRLTHGHAPAATATEVGEWLAAVEATSTREDFRDDR